MEQQTHMSPQAQIIPEDINTYDLRRVAALYHKLGIAPHPIRRPKDGKGGKQPVIAGWWNLKPSDVDEAYLDTHFGSDSNHNIGCVLAGNHVVIDLESCADKGESARQWVEKHPTLANVPREHTRAGMHIHMKCSDIPKWLRGCIRSLVCSISSEVSAELYIAGKNIVISPSEHASGDSYTWNVTGEIPEIRFAVLCRTFGFESTKPRKGEIMDEE